MLNDLRFALRSLLKTPAFTAIAVITVALAIGANSAVFTLVNSLLIRPLPYRDASRLVLIWEQFATMGLERIPVSAPEFLDYEKAIRSCEQIAAFDYTAFNVGGEGNPERVSGAAVSPSLFPLLGVDPIAGRTFTLDEQGEGHDDRVVISARFWKRRFNSDPGLIGRTILLNGRAFTVIGVMPATFEFPIPLFGVQGNRFAERVDIWKPIAFTKPELEARGSRSYGMIGRLRDGVSRAEAQGEISTITAEFIRSHPGNYDGGGFGATVYPLRDQIVGGMRTGLGILLGAVAFVLLIACANLATMLLARATAREREVAIRVALGAHTWRLLRQMLCESVVLALTGGAFGVLLSIWALDLLKRVGAQTIPRLSQVTVDIPVLIFTAAVAITTGVFFGLIPALASRKPELTEALKEGGRGSTSGAASNRLRSSLVAAEIALALVLLVSAGLLMKSFARLQEVSPGFNPHGVLTAELSLPSLKYPDNKAIAPFFQEIIRRLAQLPGVQAVACADILPLSGTNSDSSFDIEGKVLVKGQPSPDEEVRSVTPDYFRVLQTPLLKGRLFSNSDTSDAPLVAIINEAFAHKYFPNGDALGKRITFDDPKKNPAWTTIVGIVGNIRHRALDLDPEPEYYLPHAQSAVSSGRSGRNMILVVRSAQDPRTLAAAIRREVQTFDPDLPIARVRTFDDLVSESVAPRKLSVVLLGVFAGIALLLAAVGIYGVISYLVVQRTHEIGVRMALGAQRRDVLTLVINHALKLVGIGTAAGLVLALFATRALGALLYQIGPFDLVTFAEVALALGLMALLASYIPALRATRSDPMIALAHQQ
ncbi:MAG: ABC transporter permease [Verrucomicrobia bacterium]|nr:ABC transporter permease [Verrucomicrobiota bacterium]